MAWVTKLVAESLRQHEGELHLDVAKVARALPLNYTALLADGLLPYRPDNRAVELRRRQIHGEHFDYYGQADR